MSIESCSLYSQIYYSNFFLFFIIRYTHWVQHKLTPSEQCHRAHIAWSQSWHATVWPPESNRTHTPSHAFSWAEKKKKGKRGQREMLNQVLLSKTAGSNKRSAQKHWERVSDQPRNRAVYTCSVNGWETFWLAAGFGFLPPSARRNPVYQHT